MSRGLKSYSNKRDANEKGIVTLIASQGITVTTHDRPWDVCATFGSLSRWAEIKAPRNKKNDPKPFTAKQLETLKTWPMGHIDVLVTDEETLLFCQKLKADSLLIDLINANKKRPDGAFDTPARPDQNKPILEA